MILVLDGANLLHRARSGFTLGEHHVAFNFFRGLRPIIDKFKPTRVYMALEGVPKRQLTLLPDYKANRTLDPAAPDAAVKLTSLQDFWRQKARVIALLKAHFPISVMWHPDFEGDDVIGNIVGSSSSTSDFVVVSTDTDFIQLVRPNVRLYNPVTKLFVEAPVGYDYCVWKALRGDPGDNVPGLMSDKQAIKLLTDPEASLTLEGLNEAQRAQFERNHAIIQFHQWSPAEAALMNSSAPTRDWERVKVQFNAWEFKSITRDGAWEKFIAPFETLWP